MEIGGDFWLDNISYNNDCNKEFFDMGKDHYFVMSGRTAIDVVIQDIIKEKKVRNVYFPSYSCESMQEPFIDRNIKIDFYNVYFDNTLKYDIDLEHECDIFFAMNYFGYTSTNMESYIKEFKKKNVIVIEDITHSLLSDKIFSKYSDYLVCSLRKWFPIICGGLVAKINGNFNINFDSFTLNKEVIDNKKMAMQIKELAVKANDFGQNKEEYLHLYKKANSAIKLDYINKKIDDNSLKYLLNVDLKEVRKKRQQNVDVIYKNIKDMSYSLLIDSYDRKNDCLLYVPIYVDKATLIKIKEKIYLDKFYCPSHWPIDSQINDLYEHELSIVCDQRYTKEQIEKKCNKQKMEVL